MSKLAKLSQILDQEPEEWLGYLYGQQLEALDYLKDRPQKYRGVLHVLIAFFAYLGRAWIRRGGLPTQERTSLYCYAGSVNQLASLVPTTNALVVAGETVDARLTSESPLSAADSKADYQPIPATLSDLIWALMLLARRGPSLYRRLRVQDPILVSHFLIVFWKSYFFVAHFYRYLGKHRPEWVIVSNDHNVDCRSLMLVAHALGIKTVYMQHASVSEVFPALTMDYAFLDGRSALETYLGCESNRPPASRSRGKPVVVLSGQKKPLGITRAENPQWTGFAANMLDDADRIMSLVDALVAAGCPVSLRWHPRQKAEDVARFRQVYAENDRVRLSDPREEPIARYLGALKCLVSGNSSVHLEAAIAGVCCIYHEVQPPFIEDYYGYVRHGLSLRLDSLEALVEFISQPQIPTPDPESVQYYSATYGTEWHGREGELVADALIKIAKGEDPKQLFGYCALDE